MIPLPCMLPEDWRTLLKAVEIFVDRDLLQALQFALSACAFMIDVHIHMFWEEDAV